MRCFILCLMLSMQPFLSAADCNVATKPMMGWLNSKAFEPQASLFCDVARVGNEVLFKIRDPSNNLAGGNFDLLLWLGNSTQLPPLEPGQTRFTSYGNTAVNSFVNYTLPLNMQDTCNLRIVVIVKGTGSHEYWANGTVVAPPNGAVGMYFSSDNTWGCCESLMPTVTCPANQTLSTDAGQAYGTAILQPASASDNVGVVSTVVTRFVPPSTWQTTALGSGQFPVGDTVVMYTVADAVGNTASCTMHVVVKDNEAPVVMCPANQTANTIAQGTTAAVSWTVSVHDNVLVQRLSSSMDSDVSNLITPSSSTTFSVPSHMFSLGQTAVTYTAVDSSGNTASCTFYVVVEDHVPPVLTCPGDIVVSTEAGKDYGIASWTISASDASKVRSLSSSFDASHNLIGSPTASVSVNAQQQYPFGTTSVTYTAIDVVGNTAQCTFTVTVNDHEPPSVQCPSNIFTGTSAGKAYGVATWEVTAADNHLVFSLTSSLNGNNPIATPVTSFTSNVVNVQFNLGTTSVTYTAMDTSSNVAQCSFNVTVTDSQPPTIICPADITTNTVAGEAYGVVSWSVTASDNVEVQSLVSSLAASTNIIKSPTLTAIDISEHQMPLGHTTVTYVATDDEGLSAQCSFSVTVEDHESPVVTCPSDITTATAPGKAYGMVSWDVSVSDNTLVESLVATFAGPDLIVTPVHSQTYTVDPIQFSVGATVVTYTAEDEFGNLRQCSFIVTVEDHEAPVVTCPPDMMAESQGYPTATVSWSQSAVMAVDNVDVNLVISCFPGSGFAFPVGANTVTCQATDAAHNTGTCQFTVTVADTPPLPLRCPQDYMQAAEDGVHGAHVTWPLSYGESCTPKPGDLFSMGATHVTCYGLDANGLAASCTFKVNVIGKPCKATSIAHSKEFKNPNSLKGNSGDSFDVTCDSGYSKTQTLKAECKSGSWVLPICDATIKSRDSDTALTSSEQANGTGLSAWVWALIGIGIAALVGAMLFAVHRLRRNVLTNDDLENMMMALSPRNNQYSACPPQSAAPSLQPSPKFLDA